MTRSNVDLLIKISPYVLTKLCAAVNSEELILKLVLPSENELLLTYNFTYDEYVGAIAKAAIEKPIIATNKPHNPINHTRLQSDFNICDTSIV